MYPELAVVGSYAELLGRGEIAEDPGTECNYWRAGTQAGNVRIYQPSMTMGDYQSMWADAVCQQMDRPLATDVSLVGMCLYDAEMVAADTWAFLTIAGVPYTVSIESQSGEGEPVQIAELAAALDALNWEAPAPTVAVPAPTAVTTTPVVSDSPAPPTVAQVAADGAGEALKTLLDPGLDFDSLGGVSDMPACPFMSVGDVVYSTLALAAGQPAAVLDPLESGPGSEGAVRWYSCSYEPTGVEDTSFAVYVFEGSSQAPWTDQILAWYGLEETAVTDDGLRLAIDSSDSWTSVLVWVPAGDVSVHVYASGDAVDAQSVVDAAGVVAPVVLAQLVAVAQAG